MLRRRFLAASITLISSLDLCLSSLAAAAEAEPLRVMTYNIWVGGEASRLPLEQTVGVIKAAKADLVGLQETGGEEKNGRRPDNGRVIAEKLSWHYFDQGGGMGIASRYKIVDHTPKRWGVQVELPSGRRVWHFNVHFAHAPYQPYQLLKIPYADAPFIEGAEQAIAEARKARGHQLTATLEEVKSVADKGAPIVITGDFNEPSVLDWTEAEFHAGRCPVAVRWPTTAAVHDAGFVDAYRELHKDPVKSPGYTWTPITAENDPMDRHDRIDFVFVYRARARITKVEIVGEKAQRADIVVKPFPSDHRCVVATIVLDP